MYVIKKLEIVSIIFIIFIIMYQLTMIAVYLQCDFCYLYFKLTKTS